MNFEKFIKLMGMTTSQHDGEALNALRMANAELASTGKTWEDVLRGKLKAPAPYTVGAKPPGHDNIATVLDKAFEDAMFGVDTMSKFYATLSSIQQQYERQGWITQPQKDLIFKTAKENREKHKRNGRDSGFG